MFLHYSRTLGMAVLFAGAVALAASPVLAAQGRAGGQTTPKVTQAKPPTVPPGQARPVTGAESPKPATPKANAATPKPIVVKPALAGILQPLLPANTDISIASQGFKNLGQFVSALHASNNLEIPFDTLRTRLVTDQWTLGQAIKTLKPAADVTVEVAKAERQAKADIDRAGR